MLLRLPPFAFLLIFGILFGILRFLLLLPFRRRLPLYADLRVEGPLLWQRPPRIGLGSWFRKGPSSVEGLRSALRRLAEEPRLRGVVVSPRGLRASLPRIETLAEELRRFRGAGKEVILMLREGGALEFVLASSADRVVLAPGGSLHLVGASAVLTGARGLLDRLGILPEFVRIGDFKTAPELFTHREPSEIQRKVSERLLDSRYERLLEVVAKRVGGREQARRIVDGGPYTSGRALDAGLVDELVYPAALGEWLVDRAKAEPTALGILPAEMVLHSRRWRAPTPRFARPRILVVPIAGVLRTGRSMQLPMGPRFAGEDTVVAQLEAARRDPRIRGVVVVADSRGGMASASERVGFSVARLAKEKPTAAYVESVAASGGYLAIAGAGRIFASRGALVGSIGVFAGRFVVGSLLERLGIHREVLRRGESAGLLTGVEPLREEERRNLEAETKQIYEEFVSRVAEGRSCTPEEIRPHGEGRVFLAEEAPAVLVDEIGDLGAAVAWVGAQAKIPAGHWELRVAQDRATRYGSFPAVFGELARLTTHDTWLWAADLPAVEGFWDAMGEGRGYSEST